MSKIHVTIKMKTSKQLEKTNVVELEILYKTGVHSLSDHFLNDGLCPKYMLT